MKNVVGVFVTIQSCIVNPAVNVIGMENWIHISHKNDEIKALYNKNMY